jgi:5-methylcytosine-specific restriction endonuclease McrA
MASKKKTQIREQFRRQVFTRDGYKCRVCGASGQLDTHHIIPREHIANGGYVKENGITLCSTCHLKAEDCLQMRMPMCLDYLPSELYKLIGSDAIKACEKALELSV